MADVSTDCLRLLIRTWPIVAPTAFDLRLVQLERSRSRVLRGSSEQLAIALEQRIREMAGRLSLDVQGQLRDSAWFDGDGQRGGPDKIDLANYLRTLAEEYLVHQGSHIALRDDARLLSRAVEWGWLIRYLPCDLLISALETQTDRERVPTTDHVTLAPPQLREILAGRVTQEHLHLGAGQSFIMLWTGLMHRKRLVQLPLKPKDNDRGDMPFGTGARFHQRLLQAGVMRLLLGDFLLRRQQGAQVDFQKYLAQQQPFLLPETRRQREHTRGLSLLVQILGTGTGPPGEQPTGPLRSLVCHGIGRPALHTQDVSPEHALLKLYSEDPLSRYLVPAVHHIAPEIRFGHLALRYLCHGGNSDSLFATCFWQYQRIRCAVFRYLVQEPGVAGFDWFRRFYRRITDFAKALDDAEVTLAMHHSAQDITLAAFEGRKAPADSSDRVLNTIRKFGRQARGYKPVRGGGPRPEVGLVLHFVKDAEEDVARSEKLSRHLVANLPYRRRHHFWYRSRARQARAVYAVLRDRPQVLLLLRGIDVANRELTVGTWATARLLLPLREISRTAAATMQRLRPEWNVGPLRLTYHTGEEFRRLSEGLRRTHELIETGLLQNGDRLGHGLALGMVPRQWARGAMQVAQPADERLDDLLWELDRYADGDIAAHPQRLEPVRREALELAAEIYGAEADPLLSIENLQHARALRHQLTELRRQGYGLLVGERDDVMPAIRCDAAANSARPGGERAAHQLLHRYLYDESVYRRGQRPVLVLCVNPELDFLEQIQQWLRSKIAQRDITIESNPSSNLLIGSYHSLEEHPVMQLQPIEQRNPSSVPISINDDNSLTFSTCIADEYAQLFYALQRQRVSTHEALSWLQARRETGWQSRFTLSASAQVAALDTMDGDISFARRHPDRRRET